MAFDFTKDRSVYFDWQYRNAKDSIVPFVNHLVEFQSGCNVLEIGCNDGGVLKAFTELGCHTVGVDIYAPGIEAAKINMMPEIASGQALFFSKDIYKVNPETEFKTKFDLIILKDVIEHIPNQQKLMLELPRFLKPNGVIYLGFPPWQMPFGGHQQGSKNYLLSRLPYYHLLPKWFYHKLFLWAGDQPDTINELMNVYDTRISIEDFDKILKSAQYKTLKRAFYFINPIYEYKFGLKTRKLWKVLTQIPFLRNFLTTSVYYLIKPISR